MSRVVTALALTREAFAPFGEVIDTQVEGSFFINNGRAERFHALGVADTADQRVLISIVRSAPYEFPLKLALVERHPLGSQAFMPLSLRPFVVVVCPDLSGRPGEPLAFLTSPGQGVNYRRGVWHGVLTPLGEQQDFLVVDRAGADNLEAASFPVPFEIHLPSGAWRG